MIESRISAILLAAGTSRRMGGRDKLLLEYEGKSLLHRAVELLDCLPVYERILVTTKARFEIINSQYILAPASLTSKASAQTEFLSSINASNPQHPIRAIINPHPEKGQSGSLRLGLNAASGDCYLFLAADQPLLTQTCLQPMFELAETNADKIIFPSINGVPCTPTMFPGRFREDLLGLTGDTGGRAVREAYPESCLAFDVKHPECFIDIDSETDYRSLKSTIPG
jgi:molybdenum cofactor cytidylyltransferase